MKYHRLRQNSIDPFGSSTTWMPGYSALWVTVSTLNVSVHDFNLKQSKKPCDGCAPSVRVGPDGCRRRVDPLGWAVFSTFTLLILCSVFCCETSSSVSETSHWTHPDLWHKAPTESSFFSTADNTNRGMNSGNNLGNWLVSSPARGTYNSITCSLAAIDIVPLVCGSLGQNRGHG